MGTIVPYPLSSLRVLSEMKKKFDLSHSEMTIIRKNDLFFIADWFPLLEELNLGFSNFSTNDDFLFHEIYKWKNFELLEGGRIHWCRWCTLWQNELPEWVNDVF